jgi:D-alanyl-D-alanine carboxypeptidase/D-alanyl-D-alanine-endopeptidase (penicillin-binding protein 4)
VTRSSYGGPLVLRGTISRRTSVIRWSVPIADPARFVASVLRESLAERGITVAGGVRGISERAESPVAGRSLFAPAFGSGSPMRVVAIHTSPRLLDVLEIVNKRSNNFLAEQVLRTIGRVARGKGSVEGGAEAIALFADQRLSIDASAIELHDGSGLSSLNRTSARSIVHLLSFASESRFWDPFWTTLPETGAADGLRRMIGTPAQGRLRAKTGTINRVSALSGYVFAATGERLAFSILNNRAASAWSAKRTEDEIGAVLARFERPTAIPGDPDLDH